MSRNFGGYLCTSIGSQQGRIPQKKHRKIKTLHQYDCLRATKGATSAWGLEARVPFLDKEFINVAMSIDPNGRWKAFDDEEKPFLQGSKHILYRQKEQFSDGVGYSWIDGLKAHAEQYVTDRMMLNAAHIFPIFLRLQRKVPITEMILEVLPQNSASPNRSWRPV
ncbi:Transcription factor as1 [Datura stramonium]|uniref:Transcription factor as1 n=1 Tax=Datura stramonium TaxID=4076 RepID=A0ABS8TC11_DATST|nr:Transcription factor as1 [Datura stramonium]